MNPLHNHPYASSGFTSQDATNAPAGQTGQEPAAGGPPWPAPPRVLPNQALPELRGYGAGPQQAQQAGTRTPPVAATVIWPASVSYSAPQALSSAPAGGLPPPAPHLVLRSQAQQPRWPLPADPGHPVPDNFPAFMPGYLPPSLEQPPVLPATPYGSSAPVPPVPAGGTATPRAGLGARGASKRPAPDAAGSPQPKRPLPNHPGTEVAAAAAGPSEQAWPRTRRGAIACPTNVLKSLYIGGRSTRQLQFKHYDLKAGVVSIRAVAQACSKVDGTLAMEHDGKGVYAFDNVVLTAKTKITQSDKLVEDQPIGTVYLELGKAEDGTDRLSDLHLLIPETVSETPQTLQVSEPPYANDKDAILRYMRSGEKGNKSHEVSRRAKEAKAEQPEPSHPFAPDKVKSYLSTHKRFFKTLGCEHLYQVDQLLRECEKVLGGPPGNGEHRLTLMRGKQEHRLLWVVEGGYTTHLIDARDEEQAQWELGRRRLQVMGAQAARLARDGGMPSLLRGVVQRIAERREEELTALAWGDHLASVVRTLSLRCDMALSDPEYGSVKSCPEDAEVMEFHLQPPRESGGKPARGLRWVREGKVNDILFFEEGRREEAIEKIAKFKKESNAKRERSARKKNAAARAGGADG